MAQENGNEKKVSEMESPRKFLFVSWESLSGDLAWQLKKEGHEVKIYIQEKTDVYEGFLERVPDWKAYTDWADVIVFDDTGFGKEAEQLRKAGKLVIGGSMYTDRLEDDREFGQIEMKRAGMLILPYWNFDNYDTALAFIKENPGRYVYKPSGLIHSDLKGFLFIGQEEDGKDLYEILLSNKEMLNKKIKQFQLQKFVSGVEIAVSAFFNGVDFIYPVFINFEHKRIFPGDIGPFTGEMGTSAFWAEPNFLFRATIGRMKEALATSGYVGFIDINCIVNGRGIYPLEFTCRFGYPTISIQMEGMLSKWGEFLFTSARNMPYDLKTKKGFQIGVVCATPPYPYSDKMQTEFYHDLSILFKKPNFEGVHLGDVKRVGEDWRIAGNTGYDLVVTGSGSTMGEARKQAYARIDNIMLQNMFYRADIGANWSEDSDKLQTWGYLKL